VKSTAKIYIYIMSNSLLPLVFISMALLGSLTCGSLMHRENASASVSQVVDKNNILARSMALLMAYFTTTVNLPDTYWVSTILSDTAQLFIYAVTLSVLVTSVHCRWYKSRSTFEYSILVLFAILGLSIINHADHLILIYLGLELYSYSVIIITNMEHRSGFSTEAGLKFFRVGSFASIIFLLGSALVYTETGGLMLSSLDLFSAPLALSLLSLSVLMKLASAPFHWWAPDVYEGVPTESTLFMVLVPKLALTVFRTKVMIRHADDILQGPLLLVGVLSVLVGTMGAIQQPGVKRFLAYSGISHIGFIVLGFASLSTSGLSAAIFYLLLYIVVSLMSWSVASSVLILSHDSTGIKYSSVKYLSQFTGMGIAYRGIAVTMAFSMFSIAGLPPFAGFFAKMDVLREVVGHNWLAALSVILISVVSTFYYLRLTKLIFFESASNYGNLILDKGLVPEVVSVAGLILVAFILFPQPLYILSIGIV